MWSLLRGLGSAIAGEIAWWWGLPLAVAVVIAAISFAPGSLAFALLLLVGIPAGITVMTAHIGTLRARARHLEHLENEREIDSDLDSTE